jgi:hypothetical protein
MSSHKHRVTRLEARQRGQPRHGEEHFTSLVFVPPGVPSEAWGAWLDSQPCACGRTSCTQRRVGALLPEQCQSPDAWAAWYGREDTR